jgi:homoserine dehydrogenase
MKHLRIILCGMGNVHRNFVKLVLDKREHLRERYALELSIVGATDSSGAVFDTNGLDLQTLFDTKHARQGVAVLPNGRADIGGVELLDLLDADMLLEATPVNLKTGEPGLSAVRKALKHGKHCVLANKAPLALAFAELSQLSDFFKKSDSSPALRFSACVGGAMPTINVGVRDLAGAAIHRVEAVLNGTTQSILRMMETGMLFDNAVKEMQRRGLAETDPSLDTEGWDAANKLVIIANAVLRQPTTLHDVSVEGITQLSEKELLNANAQGERIVLLCLAERDRDDFRLSVKPTALPADHPLARMDGDEMGVVYYSDIMGRTHLTTRETDPVPTAAAMLRDVIDIASAHSCR